MCNQISKLVQFGHKSHPQAIISHVAGVKYELTKATLSNEMGVNLMNRTKDKICKVKLLRR